MVNLITDQRQLLKLAFGLSVDLEFLMERIKSDPQTLDDASRSQLLEGVFVFLRGAIGLTEVKNHLLTIGQKRVATSELVRPTHVQAPPALRVPTLNIPMGRKSSPKVISWGGNLLVSKELNERRCFLVTGLPFKATPSQVLEHIYGGPLERLVRKPYKDSSGCNFYINFVGVEAAARFWNFINTPKGRSNFPGRSIEVCQRPADERVDIIEAAKNPANPARRVLTFLNRKHPMSQTKLQDKLRALDKSFFHCYSLDTYRILPGGGLIVIFDCIEAAIKVKGFHKSRLLEAGSSVAFGRDPADRLIPTTKITGTSFTSQILRSNTKSSAAVVNGTLKDFLAGPAPPPVIPIFYQSINTSAPEFFIPSATATTAVQEPSIDISSKPSSLDNTTAHRSPTFLAPPSLMITTPRSTSDSSANTLVTVPLLPTLEIPLVSPAASVPRKTVPELSNVYQFGKFNSISPSVRSFSSGTVAAEMVNFADVFSSRHE